VYRRPILRKIDSAPEVGSPCAGASSKWWYSRATMRFVFTIKTKSGGVVTNVNVDAPDLKKAEERFKKENPTCTITKVETK
jgi:hypothetical protein